MNYLIASGVLNGRSSKKLASNTYLHPTIAGIKIRYYETDIIYFKKNGDILVDTDSHLTKSTKDRLNEFLPLCHQGIHQKAGVWYWKDGVPFKDRTIIREDTNLRRVLHKDNQTI